MRPGRLSRGLLALTLVGLATGVALVAFGARTAADAAWSAGTVAGLLPLAVRVVRDVLRRRAGVDLIALLAMAGALAMQQYLAGSVIAVMYTGGQTLEAFAAGRAERELSALLSRAPRVVHRYLDGELQSAGVEDVRPSDLLLVKSGEVVPVDGVVAGDAAILDESALTGESRVVERERGDQVRSGTVNAGDAFDLRAIATAELSTYAGIVRLVRQAREQKAPFVRLADRFALWFVPLSLSIAGVAWAVSGHAVRALSVLVVATPCPLILATPIAIVAGISRAAKSGVIIKNGGTLEAMARAKVLLFDKTGTLTAGSPSLASIEAVAEVSPEEILRLAASLDQVSPHVLAGAIVRASRERGLRLSFPPDVVERAGLGIQGTVDGRVVRLGSSEWVAPGGLPRRARDVRRRSALEGSSNVFVSVDGELAGALVLEDPIRPDTPRTIRALRRAGIERIVMLTGDHPEVAETIGTAIGVDVVLAERSPSEKVDAVRAERVRGVTIMVGDGINDAPALAAADVGVAMGARGATASSETADAVVMVDRLDRLTAALCISVRSRSIALQSAAVGMGLSVVAMGVAALGWLPPVAGALLQEGIDVAVILNALRALGGNGAARRPMPAEAALERKYREEHRKLAPGIDAVRSVADRLGTTPAASALFDLERIRAFLDDELLPHEQDEERSFFPIVSRVMGGEDPMGAMTRAHMEIRHLVRLYDRLVEEVAATGPTSEDIRELQRAMYGLHAVLRLHFAQEDEAYLSLAAEGA